MMEKSGERPAFTSTQSLIALTTQTQDHDHVPSACVLIIPISNKGSVHISRSKSNPCHSYFDYDNSCFHYKLVLVHIEHTRNV